MTAGISLRWGPRRRALTLMGAAVVVLTAALMATTGPARAADLTEFDPGNIITNQMFFDDGSMSTVAIQNFLNKQGAACSRGLDGSPCLKNYFPSTTSRVPTTYCPGGYAGVSTGETAASILYKVSQGCGINPQVLIVTLQKEVGLVRSTNPTAKMYERATGYACPDNTGGTCDSAYNGLQNQLYSAASQFRRYLMNPGNYAFRAGITAHILFHPDPSNCGSQAVYLQNAATAALYNYTPYVPNRAALNAGYGTGDSCSSYGNRNFYSYFTDWFGSTQSTGSAAVNLKYMDLGSAASPLGAPIAPTQCGLVNGGCARAYENGSIYWSPASGAAMLQGEVRTGWWGIGGVNGALGYPIADTTTVPGGKAGAFQGGSIYWSAATGAAAISKELLQSWWDAGGVSGSLGYPIASSGAVPGGLAGAFQGGSIYWSAPTGAHWISGDVRAHYWAVGGPSSSLGLPTSNVGAAGPGQAAAFQGGSIYASTAGAYAVGSELLPSWWATGGLSGPLGFPTEDSRALGSGKAVAFAGGTLFWSPGTGGHWLADDVLARYITVGEVTGALGFPTGDQGPVSGGTAATFEGGSIYASPATGAHVVGSDARVAWTVRGGNSGVLGFPTTDTATVAGPGGVSGWVSAFTGGTIYGSQSTGAGVLSGPVLAAFQAAGGPVVLGFPVADQGPVPGGTAVALQSASIYASAGTGAHIVRGEVRNSWWGRGGVSGPLGFPTVDDTAIPGLGTASGEVGGFSGGKLYWSAATGGRLVAGEILAAYDNLGGPAVLGFPIADQGPVTGGQAVALQVASIYSSAGTGAHMVRGKVRDAWWARGGITSTLGFPTVDDTAIPGLGTASGEVGGFSGAKLYWSAATGGRLVAGEILAAYDNLGGPAVLGFPIADQGPVTGGQAVALQVASIYSSAGTGAHMVRGKVRDAWWARGGITSTLGFPTTDSVPVLGLGSVSGATGRFGGGALYWSAATGARAMSGGVLAAFDSAGGPGVLGFPLADQGSVTGGEAVALQGASIYSSGGTGAHVVRGDALAAYWTAGSVTGSLGFPTVDTSAVSGNGAAGTVTRFSGGSIYSAPGSGARVVLAAVDVSYRAAGGPTSSYGWPISDTYPVGSGVRNDFQSGYISG